MSRAYAVVPYPLDRATQGGAFSASWTLYNPAALAKDLGIAEEVVAGALEKNGFLKAVKIREEVIRYKERLRVEQKELSDEEAALAMKLRAVRARKGVVQETLTNLRNILRLPRQDVVVEK